MIDLSGEFRHKLDAKGRLSLPSDFRKMLSRDLKITLSPKGDCLYVFESGGFRDWLQSLFDKDGGYQASNSRHIEIRKAINSRARNIEIDGSGRIGINADQREAARLEKEVVLVGDTDHFEIWDAKRWDEYLASIDLASWFDES